MRKPDSFTQKSRERPKKSGSLNKKYGRSRKNMPEFPPVFVQKIFCFVQKHETTAGEVKENIEDFFSKQTQIIKPKQEIKEPFRQKNKTFSSTTVITLI